jgi:PBSX family phage terminase large subunit
MIDIKGRIRSLQERITKIKQGRSIASKLQIFEFQPFSLKQKQVLTWWCDDSPVKDKDGIIADGAIRSGKTVSMSLSFIMWAMSRFQGQEFGMCGKTIGSFRRNVVFWLKLMLRSRGYKLKDRRSDSVLEISKNGVTNHFYIFGGKDESSQDLVQGVTLAGVFFDEVALMPESFVDQATGRCSVTGSKYWFNCNPDGPYHWFKQEWIDKATGFLGKKRTEEIRQKAKAENKPDGLKELLYVHFTMDDNLSLSEEIKARYRNNYSGIFYKRYIQGLWAAAEGVIYDMFDVDRHVKKVVEFARNLIDGARYVSIDYGTQNAMVFLLWNKGIDKKWYCTREYYYSGRDNKKQKSDSQYADDLENWLEGTPVKAIIVDPSAASFITELNNRGYKTMKADNAVEDGIRLVSTLLNTGKIAFSHSCINTIKEFASYIWDAKAGDRGEDKPIKQHDHAMDAVRYFCYTILNNKTIKIRSKSAFGFN